MRIELKEITVREVTDGYVDSQINGVVGYGGKLNIRPAFQREFIYNERERNAVIDTVQKGFPLNVMYWCDDGNDNYELLDGQQRTLSICQYVNGDFSIDSRFFHWTDPDEKPVPLSEEDKDKAVENMKHYNFKYEVIEVNE